MHLPSPTGKRERVEKSAQAPQRGPPRMIQELYQAFEPQYPLPEIGKPVIGPCIRDTSIQVISHGSIECTIREAFLICWHQEANTRVHTRPSEPRNKRYQVQILSWLRILWLLPSSSSRGWRLSGIVFRHGRARSYQMLQQGCPLFFAGSRKTV
jgi:hypothetical protein